MYSMLDKRRLIQTNHQTISADQTFNQLVDPLDLNNMPVKEEDNIQLRVGILLMTSHAVFSDNDRRNDPQD